MTAVGVEKRFVRNEGFLPDRMPANWFEDDSDDTDDDLEDILSALKERITNLETKSKELKQSLNEKMERLSEEVNIEDTRSKSLIQNVEMLGDKHTTIVKNNSIMRDQLDNLRSEWEILSKSFKSCNNFPYDLDKIAVCVEQAMCSLVFPEAFKNGAIADLHNLLNFLNGSDSPFNSSCPESNGKLRAAKEKWESICETFGFPKEWKSKSGEWDVKDDDVPDDIRAIEVLKLSQAKIGANEKLSLKNAEKNLESMRDELAPWQFELVAAFIGSLREKMTKSGLSHKCLCFD